MCKQYVLNTKENHIGLTFRHKRNSRLGPFFSSKICYGGTRYLFENCAIIRICFQKASTKSLKS